MNAALLKSGHCQLFEPVDEKTVLKYKTEVKSEMSCKWLPVPGRAVKPILLVFFVLVLVLPAMADTTNEERDLSSFFGKYSGAFVILDAAHGHWLRHHPDLCRKRVTPCSTFKIPNSLISLETGVASDADFSLPWDGTRYPIEPWNRDQTLRSAFAVSCLWFYQELARRVGSQRMNEWVAKIHYGNCDLSGGVTHFWLSSSLTISPDEQVDFLRRLHTRQLPFSTRSVDIVLDIMTVLRRGQTVYRGKTGTAGDPVKQMATQGWWVGSVCTPKGDYYFATCITGGDNPSGRTARQITENILEDLKVLTSSTEP